jgi:hypothetical protein
MPHGRLYRGDEEAERVTIRLRKEHWNWLGEQANALWMTEVEIIQAILGTAVAERIAQAKMDEEIRREAQSLLNRGLAER